MLREFAVITALGLLAAAHAQAADTKMDKTSPPTTMSMECTDAEMTKMNTQIEAMSAADKKKMAMDHMGMAKDSMAKKDMEACKKHMMEGTRSYGQELRFIIAVAGLVI